MKRIAVLGSTGSIGCQALDVVRALPERFRVVALAAGRNAELLARQVDEFRPRLISLADGRAEGLFPLCDVVSPEDIVRQSDVDIVVMATSGKAGLAPTLAALSAAKTVALANKEVLVMAGETVMAKAKRHGARILPVDSEHSAIWQCLEGEAARPSKIVLTASGGPFYRYSKAQLEEVTVKQALNHPSWKMGKKVTIDSATLMNKGLEVMEAHWLFDMPFDDIQVVIHPQSIIHSMVEFPDRAIKAQLSSPDMRLPIQYALTYPERVPNPGLLRLDWSRVGSLTFQPPDYETFPCLRLAIGAGRRGGTYPAVLCGADEVAVELFLSGRIRFMDIPRLVEKTLEQHQVVDRPTLEEILEADTWARCEVLKLSRTGEPC